MQLTPHQQEAFDAIKAFIRHDAMKAFVLKGYAGTGKTTLIGKVVEWLGKNGYQPVLMATTGRAAKVLENKTGTSASTIHSCIYVFDEVAGQDESGKDPWNSETGQLFLNFDLRQGNISEANSVYIVDEASMISHEPDDKLHTARFGSGSLLDDFLVFAGDRKVIFVGDPCQLPPVHENPFSAALEPVFLRTQYGMGVGEFELKTIMRQERHSEILQLAGKFREDIIQKRFEKYPKIRKPGGSNAHLYGNDQLLLKAYVERLRKDGFDQAIMIGYANWQCQSLNMKIRDQLFGTGGLRAGELLMVVQNSYYVDLANGDQAIVLEVSDHDNRAGFGFMKVKLKALHNGQIFETLMIKDLLYNDQAGLTPDEVRRLIIDFAQRMKNRNISRNSDAFKKAMLEDPYLNALRAKFGYVVTGHKSQGGEWPHVFLNIYKSLYGWKDAQLYRWYYTVLTRAQEHLHVNDGWWIEGFNNR